MREIDVTQITDSICKLCISANLYLNSDIEEKLKQSLDTENSERGRIILADILKNADIARKNNIPICQDTGMAIVFLKIGQDIHFVGGSLYDAVNEGVRQGYDKGYLRKSVVKDPIRRGNTNDNTPAIIHTEIVDGESVEITVAPKGFGSENMSAVKMCKPSEGREGIVNFVLDTVKNAGGNPCPPIVVGVGVGGSFEKCAYLAKKALSRDINTRNEDDYYFALENELLEKINNLDVGPQGLGGTTTALGVNVETFPTHIAGMPVAVNISCHVTRHASCII